MNRREWRDHCESRNFDHEMRGRGQGDYEHRGYGTARERHPMGPDRGFHPGGAADAEQPPRDRGGYDPYRESYYGLPGGFYGGLPGGPAGLRCYDRGQYADREFYGGNRNISDAFRDHGSDRGLFERAADEVSSWLGDEDAEHRRERDHRGRGPKNYKRSDSRVEEDVCDRLTDDGLLDASDITVQVSDREVTLDGTVSTRNAKRRAEDCADSVSGVQHVQNNLRVCGMDAMSSASTSTTTGRQT